MDCFILCVGLRTKAIWNQYLVNGKVFLRCAVKNICTLKCCDMKRLGSTGLIFKRVVLLVAWGLLNPPLRFVMILRRWRGLIFWKTIFTPINPRSQTLTFVFHKQVVSQCITGNVLFFTENVVFWHHKFWPAFNNICLSELNGFIYWICTQYKSLPNDPHILLFCTTGKKTWSFHLILLGCNNEILFYIPCGRLICSRSFIWHQAKSSFVVEVNYE